MMENYTRGDLVDVKGVKGDGDGDLQELVDILKEDFNYPSSGFRGYDIMGVMMTNGSWFMFKDYQVTAYGYEKLGNALVVELDLYRCDEIIYVHFKPNQVITINDLGFDILIDGR